MAAAYPLLLRRWCLTWGATPDEVSRRLPGDELLPDADGISTRAISIDAPPSAIWPWLLQMGPGRGGAYTYDWIENLFCLGMHSADRILPEFQDLKVGDTLVVGRDEMRVERLDPQRVMVWRSGNGRWVWIFALDREDGTTRLVSRNRFSTSGASLGTRLATAAMEPGSLVMERKMLLGLKQRAERLAREREGAPAANGGTAG